MHTHPDRCVETNFSAPGTLRQVLAAGPAILAMGFPCQPYSYGGHQRGFADERSDILHTLLAYAAVVRPKALALECVEGFATMAQGTCAQELRTSLAILPTAYRMQVETIGLRGVRPITRTRWLAFCPRRDLWDNLPLQIRQGIVGSEWELQTYTLETLGIPRKTCDRTTFRVPQTVLQRYVDPAYCPRTHHSRFLQDWDALPALTHSMGSEFGPCPCRCRRGGLSETHLRGKGIFALLVRTEYGARFPAPEEIAQLMGFPMDPFWRSVDPMTGFLLLGNSTSPSHAARVLGRSRLFQSALTGEPLPLDLLPRTVQSLLAAADTPLSTRPGADSATRLEPITMPATGMQQKLVLDEEGASRLQPSRRDRSHSPPVAHRRLPRGPPSPRASSED